MKQRLALLLAHDINLFAYHLPLDAHPELGNNAQLGARLGLRRRRRASASRSWASSARAADGAASPTREALAAHVRAGAGPAGDAGGRRAGGRSRASPGAPAARRATSRRRSPPAPRPSSPARSPSRRRTTRARCGVSLPGLRPPCHRALRRAGGGGARGGAARPRARVHRHRQPGMSATRSRIAITLGDPAGIGPRDHRQGFPRRARADCAAASWPATWLHAPRGAARAARRRSRRCRSR